MMIQLLVEGSFSLASGNLPAATIQLVLGVNADISTNLLSSYATETDNTIGLSLCPAVSERVTSWSS